MELLRVVFFHTKDILKGRGLKIFLALFGVSLSIMLYMEGLQLAMDVSGSTYSIVSFFLSLLNILANYIVMFLFIKAVRNEPFRFADIRFGISRIGLFIAMGLLLSILQILVNVLCAFLGSITFLYLILYTLVYAFFMAWNALIAYGIYDRGKFGQVLSVSVQVMKDHIGEVFMAALCLMIWYLLGQSFVPRLTDMILSDSLYAGAILPGLIVGANISVTSAILITLVNLVYYSGLYACCLPLYTYLAKLYNDDTTILQGSTTKAF
ncbi:MAG: hypothetical protein RR531_06030 [Longicatena sp.]